MASIFTHSIVGLALGRTVFGKAMPRRFWFLCAVSASLPDIDVLGFAIGIEYGDLLGHRGLSHSLFFALVAAILVTLLAFRRVRLASSEGLRLVFCFFLVIASHALLDAWTDGGLGIAFFSPFDPTRYFFPFRPIAVSPIGVDAFFSSRGVQVLSSELLWVLLPTALWLTLVEAVRWWARRAR